MRKAIISLVTIALTFVCACEVFEPATPDSSTLLDGPIEGLTESENLMFLRGDVAFNDEIFTPETGLGPLFVATSCGSCHPGDGKGHPFTTLIRFGQTDESGNQYLDAGGPQLQNHAIPGFTPEQIPAGVAFSKITPPANTGLGYIDAVSDETILEWADPDDEDADGISGVPNWVYMKDYLTARAETVEQDGKYIGRFGKKGAAYDLHQQTAGAYNQDIGITSSYEPVDPHTGMAIDPEISDLTIQDVVFYLKTLKAPISRNTNNQHVIDGKQIFNEIGCAKCHRPELKTGYSTISVLSNQMFYPYTDLLLHDMGPVLDDGYTEGSAKTYEWKTPPLWGLGLSKFSQGGEYFLLHDGRARSIEEAIILHEGEGEHSSESYQELSAEERLKLIKFLESL